MDPTHPGPEDQDSGGITRAIPLIAGEYLLTINPVDGSEVEPCPPGEHPGTPRRRTADSRAERERAALPPVPTGVSLPDLPLLERDEVRERLVRLLRRGRSVRLTGPRGSGRTALLSAVAAECADLAPDGVVRLSGCRRTPADLLYDLFAAVHDAPRHRPDRAELLEALRRVGAVVLLDDVEFGGQGLDSLLDATPECAFLISATPDTPAPSADAPLEEVFLSGISRDACRELMEHVVRRPLTEEEANWAADLWFESEGLPLRFVQAGALLKQRDASGGGEDAGTGRGEETAEAAGGPLPTLAAGTTPVPLLAAGLSGTAREVLRFAVALDGVLPHPAHLPALVDDARADTALGELLACGLVTAAGAHHRLAPGAAGQLAEAGYGDGADERAHTAARHYAWWTGHPSVTPERVAQEAEAVLAAVQGAQRGGHPSAAVLLARTAAPTLAASLYWSAWERMLRSGQEAARTAGEVAEEAYFHHDLGVLALCTGNLDRARAELEASIGLRGALADRRGTVAGRRALALVEDRSALRTGGTSDGTGGTPEGRALPGGPVLPRTSPAKAHTVPPVSPTPSPSPSPSSALRSEQRLPSGPQGTADGTQKLDKLPPTLAVPPVTVGSAFDEPSDTGALTRPTPVVRSPLGPGGSGPGPVQGRAGGGPRRLAVLGARRNVLAAGVGALLAVAVGTVVTLGMASDGEEPTGSVNPAVTSREDEGITVDDPAPSSSGEEKEPGQSGEPSVPASGTPSADGTGSADPEDSPSGKDEDDDSSGDSGEPTESSGSEGRSEDADDDRPPANGSGGSGSGGSGSGGSGSGGSGGSGSGGSDGSGGSGSGGSGGSDQGGTDTEGTDTEGTETGGSGSASPPVEPPTGGGESLNASGPASHPAAPAGSGSAAASDGPGGEPVV
ncbi:ATP-binding protein [Streptomyces glaucosporus]|uniref:ATP-binding protein n=1 Tax=Streptomyces glaucosporus TaxID=284044 RepID=A0ABN3IAY8_9ACTN